VAVSVDGWERLFSEYGGGPVVDSAEPSSVCEPCQLPFIRREEKRRIAAVDTAAAQGADGSPFLMISAAWLNQWRAFVSANGPRPGPISNHTLFEPDGTTLLPGLRRGEHYRALHEVVWQALRDIYGGGPVIERPSLDIYSTEAAPQPQQSEQQQVDEPPTDEDSDEEGSVEEIDTAPQAQQQQQQQQQQSQHAQVQSTPAQPQRQ